MQIIDDLSAFEFAEHTVVTSGTFDGVHVGHQKLLTSIVEKAHKNSLKSVVLTFWPHPRFVLGHSSKDLHLLTTFEEKSALIAQNGIDFLVKIPFTKEFSQTNSKDFIQQILVDKLKTKELVIGYDHKFGKNREGGFEYLQANAAQFGFNVQEIARQDIDDIGISSTKVRKALQSGDIPIANEFLGRYYRLSGFVKEGDRIGRSIGFPTANIDVPESYKLIPEDGAYAVYVWIEGARWPGMMNIGMRPTVSGQERRIEVHIIGFEQQIYNERIAVDFVQMLRKEQKFASIDALRSQLEEDKELALRML